MENKREILEEAVEKEAKELSRINALRNEQQGKLTEAKNKLAEHIAKFKIGSFVINERGVKARIIKIRLSGYSLDRCDYRGIRIKKDGSDGAEIELHSWNKWSAV